MGLYDQYPKYATTKPRLISTVLFTAFFGLVFQLLTIPFVRNTWLFATSGPAFLASIAFELLSLGVIIVSKWRLYIASNTGVVSYLNFALRSLTEAVVIAALYTFITIEGYEYGILSLEHIPNLSWILVGSFVFAFIVLGISYAVTLQYFDIMDKNNTIRLMNFSTVVSDTQVSPQEEEKITLFDDSGVLKLVLSINSIYFVESNDNYVNVWYSDSTGEMRQYMLRCRLKTVEESFVCSDLVRCHRKYIVNATKIVSLRSEKDGYYIDLGISSAENLPVSKTYEESILSKFNSR